MIELQYINMSIIMVWTHIFLDICIANIFSQRIYYLLTLLVLFYKEYNFSFYWNSPYQIAFFCG